jgi:hypothetical protein
MSGDIGAVKGQTCVRLDGIGWAMKRTYFFGAFRVWLPLYARANAIFPLEPIPLDKDINCMPVWDPACAIKSTSIDE